MSRTKKIKQRVCFIFFTFGLSLAALNQATCHKHEQPMVNQKAQSTESTIILIGT